MISSAWTDDRIAMLKELNDKGSNAWIAREINRATGSAFTRNAIIGRCHRDGLPKPERKAVLQQIPRKKPAPRERKSWQRKGRFVFGPRIRVIDPEVRVARPPQDFLGVPFMKLKDSQCRYPDDSEPLLFCGQPVQVGSSYCPHCHSLCRTKGRERGERDYSYLISRTA